MPHLLSFRVNHFNIHPLLLFSPLFFSILFSPSLLCPLLLFFLFSLLFHHSLPLSSSLPSSSPLFRALVQRKAVWKPCCFIYIYNVLLLSNPAWNSFLGAAPCSHCVLLYSTVQYVVE